MSNRVHAPQTEECVSCRVPKPQRDECTPTRDKQPVCDDRCDPSVFTFEPCAISAFAHETAEREARNAVTRDCANSRMHAGRESIGGTFGEENASVHDAHRLARLSKEYNRVFEPSCALFVSLELRRICASNSSPYPSTHSSTIAFAATFETTVDLRSLPRASRPNYTRVPHRIRIRSLSPPSPRTRLLHRWTLETPSMCSVTPHSASSNSE